MITNAIMGYMGRPDLEKLASKLKELGGRPTENRIVLISPTGATQTQSGLFIPTEARESLPRKGSVVQIGPVSEENYTFRDLSIGDLVTYGLYAGKEIDIEGVEIDTSKYSITVLSLNEIIYIEKQQ